MSDDDILFPTLDEARREHAEAIVWRPDPVDDAPSDTRVPVAAAAHGSEKERAR